MLTTLTLRSIGLGLNAWGLLAPEKAGDLGFRLFCRPQRPRLKPHHEHFLAKAEAFTLTDAGDEIRGYRWGSGPRRILLVHGWNSHTYFWKSYIEQLTALGFTVIAIDAPGHGRSAGNLLNLVRYARVLAEVVRQQGPFEAIVGHSIGAFASVLLLHDHPELTPQRLVLLAATANVNDFMAHYRHTLGLTPRTLRLVEDTLEKRLGNRPSYYLLPRLAQKVLVPALLVHDRTDRMAPLHYILDLKEVWPHAEVTVTEGLGHNLRSDDITTQVVGYVAQVGRHRDDRPQVPAQATTC